MCVNFSLNISQISPVNQVHFCTVNFLKDLLLSSLQYYYESTNCTCPYCSAATCQMKHACTPVNIQTETEIITTAVENFVDETEW
jgi:hypothetical protein